VFSPDDKPASIGLFTLDRALERGTDSFRTFEIEASNGSRNTASQFGNSLKGPSFAGELGVSLFNPLAASARDTLAFAPAAVIAVDSDLPRDDADELEKLDNELVSDDFALVIVDFILLI
jgi:hypothetical protein